MRQRGFEQAKKSDIFQHKRILTDLWRGAKSSGAAGRPFAPDAMTSLTAWGQGDTILEKRERLRNAGQELASIVPEQDTLILVDEAALGSQIAPRRRLLPFPEHHGEYWGPPADDAAAVAELERLRRDGASHVAIAWPAFWWLDYYAGFNSHLRSRYPCILENERLVVFDLRPGR
jgi:hypothetical protein